MSSYGTREASCIVNVFKSSQRTFIWSYKSHNVLDWELLFAEKKSQIVFSSFSDKASTDAVDIYSQD